MRPDRRGGRHGLKCFDSMKSAGNGAWPISFRLGAMPTLVVGMKIREKSPHAHDKRGHGTHFRLSIFKN
jgi:hypothetical protein